MADKYISAKQAYGYLRIILYETATNNVGINDDFASACEEIADNRLKAWLDNVPPTDVVERKKGKWGSEWFDHKLKIVCSACGCFADKMTYYCPNCGAEMETTDDES